MYKKNKIITSWIFLSAIVLSTLWHVQAHEATNTYSNINSSTKVMIENRLAGFLNTIGKYDEDKQTQAYQTLQNKIDLYESRFDINSEIYSVFEMIDLVAEHKLDTQSILSDSQILSHVIYWNDFPHYNTTPINEDSREETDTESEQEDTSNSDNVESQEGYRADLDTDDLNEVDKNILAGTAKWILQLEVRANLEGIKSETVEFRFNKNIDNIGLVWRLYHNWIFVWESSQSDARGTVLTIDNLDNFIIGTQTSYVQLEIATQAIWKEEIWEALENIRVVSTTFSDNTWVITGDKIWDRVNTTVSKNFNIVPADVIASVESEFEKNISKSEIRISPQVGTNNNNGDTYSVALDALTIKVSSFKNAWDLKVFNSRWTQVGSTTINSSWDIMIPINSDTISSWGETYRITTTAEALFRISQDWITYSAGSETYSSHLESQLLLGQR